MPTFFAVMNAPSTGGLIAEFAGLLVKVRGTGKFFATAAGKAFGAKAAAIKPILHVG